MRIYKCIGVATGTVAIYSGHSLRALKTCWSIDEATSACNGCAIHKQTNKPTFRTPGPSEGSRRLSGIGRRQQALKWDWPSDAHAHSTADARDAWTGTAGQEESRTHTGTHTHTHTHTHRHTHTHTQGDSHTHRKTHIHARCVRVCARGKSTCALTWHGDSEDRTAALPRHGHAQWE